MRRTTHELQEIMRTGRPASRELAAALLLAGLDEYLPWLAARQLDGLTLKAADGDWLLILRATYKGQPQVAFIGGLNPEDCITIMAHAVLFDLISWRPDKYRTMRSDKT